MGRVILEEKIEDGKTYKRTAYYNNDEIMDSTPWREVTEEQPFKEINKLIDKEISLWHGIGIDPKQINVDGFLLQTKIEAMMALLVATGIFESEEMAVLQLKEFLLTKLKAVRKEVTPHIQRGRTNIFGPNGELLH